MINRFLRRMGWVGVLFAFLAVAHADGVYVRVSLLEPTGVPYKIQVTMLPAYGANTVFVVGKTQSSLSAGRYAVPPANVLKAHADEVEPLSAGQATAWIDLTRFMPTHGIASVQFHFVPAESFTNHGVRARFDVATAPADKAIVRSITDHDPGNVISLRVPPDLVKDQAWLLSIREDAERRLKEIHDFHLSDGPLPKKIWCRTGFRSWDMFTDPAIDELDFQIIHDLGMNGYWDFSPATWKVGAKHGITNTTLFWRSAGSPPGAGQPGALHLDWEKLGKFVDDTYRSNINNSRQIFGGGPFPPAIVDLMDEPAGLNFSGPEYEQEFVRFLQARGFMPELFGKKDWAEVKPIYTDPACPWWGFYKTRQQLDLTDLPTRRRFYWSGDFLADVNARLYALGNAAVEKYAPEILGTRINIGPPWYYDNGTIVRGLETFDMGRLRSMTVAFNEDWVGNGDPLHPLEINTLMADWDRAPYRPRNALGGAYITADANYTAVKLRVFGVLARDAKILDYYYYGPAYGHFDAFSDNASMVRGVAEINRDIGWADHILGDAHPPRAEVALLYSKSAPIWMADDTDRVEFIMTYIALLHAGISVDIISDEQVVDGQLATGGYKCLYVVHESVPAVAATAIKHWVEGGGRLWASGWASSRDEYNTSTDSWNDLLGVRERSWKPVGDLNRYGELIGYADERRPYFSRLCRMVAKDNAGIPDGTKLTYAAATVPAGEPAVHAYQRKFGAGRVQVVPWTAGRDYVDGHQKIDGTVAKGAILYPTDARRGVIAEFAREVVQPSATSSVNQIMAWPLWSANQGVVLLANYTGQPADWVTVSFKAPMKVRSVTSLHSGKLRFETARDGMVTCTLPVRDVTDVLTVNDNEAGR